MDQVVRDTGDDRRFTMTMLSVFSGLALILASVGLYGVLAYSVAQRRREIGIRMALGAKAEDVVRLVVGQGLLLTLIGIGIGLAGAFALTRLMESLFAFLTNEIKLTPETVAETMWRDYQRGERHDPPEFLREFLTAPDAPHTRNRAVPLKRQARHLAAG